MDSYPIGLNYLDIMNYCIDGDSHYTGETFKSYKSLESYKAYKPGWVQQTYCKKTSIGYLIIGSVRNNFI